MTKRTAKKIARNWALDGYNRSMNGGSFMSLSRRHPKLGRAMLKLSKEAKLYGLNNGSRVKAVMALPAGYWAAYHASH